MGILKKNMSLKLYVISSHGSRADKRGDGSRADKRGDGSRADKRGDGTRTDKRGDGSHAEKEAFLSPDSCAKIEVLGPSLEKKQWLPC
uniref:Uncharacterized protein n=1 Tax=Leptobrachium leishanense TaxID=445787 RepID=A0A8C5QQH5_9ANUR